MSFTLPSPCKVNLILNILGRRPDGFHELETVMVPVPIHDRLDVELGGEGIALTCNDPALPVDRVNLVYRAAEVFFAEMKAPAAVRIHLEKRLPLAAGLGGGSANAAITLRALNQLAGAPLTSARLHEVAAGLGSDVPFFLEDGPALATGRGEKVERLEPFPLLSGRGLLLVHPGFGVPTAWAYRELAQFPTDLQGRPGRALELVQALQRNDAAAWSMLYNSLEAPVLRKYPMLELYQQFFRTAGALTTLMSGSGSSTFAIFPTPAAAEEAGRAFEARFGGTPWRAVAGL